MSNDKPIDQLIEPNPPSNDQRTLDIISKEIARLSKNQFDNQELTYSEARKLEVLIKLRHTILDKPVDAVVPDYGAVTDQQVLDTIKQHLGEAKPKKSRKK